MPGPRLDHPLSLHELPPSFWEGYGCTACLSSDASTGTTLITATIVTTDLLAIPARFRLPL
jgi:hypothetical protein